MKVKSDFVTNSSSSSFIIPKYYLSDHQIDLIKSHIDLCEYFYDAWSITESSDGLSIEGYTSMDNFDMGEFLWKIGVDEDHVKWR